MRRFAPISVTAGEYEINASGTTVVLATHDAGLVDALHTRVVTLSEGAVVRDSVVEAMTNALRDTGNPSSLHAAGRRARRAIEEAREQIAETLGVG